MTVKDEVVTPLHPHYRVPCWDVLTPAEQRRVVERREELVQLLQKQFSKDREDAVREVTEFFDEYFASLDADNTGSTTVSMQRRPRDRS